MRDFNAQQEKEENLFINLINLLLSNQSQFFLKIKTKFIPYFNNNEEIKHKNNIGSIGSQMDLQNG